MPAPKLSNQQTIITPDRDLSRQIEGLSADIKYSTAIGLGAGAFAGTIGLDTYSRITGNHTPVEGLADQTVGQVGPAWLVDPVGAAGVVIGGLAAGVKSVSLRKERRSLRKQEEEQKSASTRHYQENKALYQTEALHEDAQRQAANQ